MGNPILGMNAKMYFGAELIALPVTPTTVEAVTWTVLGNVRDVTTDLKKAEADVTARDNDGWRATVGTLKEGSVGFEMRWDTADAGFTAVKNAYFGIGANGELIALMILDLAKDVVGAQGLAANFSVLDMSRAEPLEGALTAAITAKPTSAQIWYEKTGS